MDRSQFKALIVTLLLFGSLLFFFVGKPDLSSLSLKDIFKKEETNKDSGKKRRNIPNAKAGQVVDSYKGVDVFYNGAAKNVYGRNTTKDGYNLGLKYQCVEFAKRFYYEVYKHKMPDSYGHAKDFFDAKIGDGVINKSRGMLQYKNKTYNKPKRDDLCIIGPSPGNKFGHLFIITKVTNTSVEFIQQNGGASNPSRGTYALVNEDGLWNLKTPYLKGWLRMP